jgi:hypothetical protein
MPLGSRIRAIALRVTEAADQAPQIQRATSSPGSLRCCVLVAAEGAAIQAGFLPQREMCCSGCAGTTVCWHRHVQDLSRPGVLLHAERRAGRPHRSTREPDIDAGRVRAQQVSSGTFVLALGCPERPEQLEDRYRCLQRALMSEEHPGEGAGIASTAEHTGP